MPHSGILNLTWEQPSSKKRSHTQIPTLGCDLSFGSYHSVPTFGFGAFSRDIVFQDLESLPTPLTRHRLGKA